MCPEQDSNLHASRHTHLKRARLPFRHLGILCNTLVTTHKILFMRAENETRTRDPNLGKVMLYQLSYFRKYPPSVFNYFSAVSRLRMQR